MGKSETGCVNDATRIWGTALGLKRTASYSPLKDIIQEVNSILRGENKNEQDEQ